MRRPPMPVPAGVEHALDAMLDKALAVQRPTVLAYLDRVRDKNRHATPAQVIEQLESRYRTVVISIGAASGGTAALPGIGTAASVAAGAAEIAAFVSATATFVLAIAELHGVPVSDPEIRRALVLATLLGEGSIAAIEAGADGGASSRQFPATHWAQVLEATSTTDSNRVKGLNARLGRMLVTRFTARQGALAFGRALPFGVGAGVGVLGNAALAKSSIKSARKVFGPAPTRFPPRVVDIPTAK